MNEGVHTAVGEYPKYPNAPFGATSPILNVARKHGVPYEDALMIYDFYLRRNPISALVHQTYNVPIQSGLRSDLKQVADYWYPVFHPVAPGVLRSG